MKTFSVQTLGCKVNQYESEQMAALLRARGLTETAVASEAELRIINTCSVTVQAASQSRQSVRRMIRLPVIIAPGAKAIDIAPESSVIADSTGLPHRPKVVVIGCWATSDKRAASEIEGVDAVLTHQDDLAAELDRLLALWKSQAGTRHAPLAAPHSRTDDPPQSKKDDNWVREVEAATDDCTTDNKPKRAEFVNEIPASCRLPLLGEHQTGRQRAFLKIQDGCDAHCTYCIIPQLRPALWSKPVGDVVEEARRLVGAGHVEIVLTGIFLGAYGQPTALRRRQPASADAPALAKLVEALCTRVAGLKRLRLSSLEPGDLSDDLLAVLTAHSQVVPHFHLPLQSGSDLILRRMNRQYRRADFLGMADRVGRAFDRPALTTDVIVGFPGESDEQFQHTLAVAEHARFIHIHAFPYSPRPGTAAARWTGQFVHGTVISERIRVLALASQKFSYEFRRGFLGAQVEVIVEGGGATEGETVLRQGRCERYFAVHFEDPRALPGQVARVRVDRVAADRTYGTVDRGGAS